jgi:hypothetical protein
MSTVIFDMYLNIHMVMLLTFPLHRLAENKRYLMLKKRKQQRLTKQGRNQYNLMEQGWVSPREGL